MNETLHQGVSDTLKYLISVVDSRLQPEEAKTQMMALQKLYPSLTIKLLWQEEAYDGSIHYNVLLQSAEVGTISLSIAAKNSLPWPLRGVQRSREQDFLKVNDMVFTVGDTVARLDFLWKEKPLTDRFIDECLIYEAIDEYHIDISDIELQEAINAFRVEHKLYQAQDTYLWLEDRGFTHEKLESLILEHTKVAKLRKHLTDSHVTSYFEQHFSDFESARVAQITFDDEISATEARELISSHTLGFTALLAQRVASAQTSLRGNGFKVLQRGQTSAEFGDIIFNASPGDILGPSKTENGYTLMQVLSFQPACLDEETITKIQQSLFKEWLAERRASAIVQWNWG
ncbi:MAG: TIGR04500 family putative peptide maturation system protein [Pseudanabaena sp. SU_2_4]|nr:TIGR04500 family putative peptide maturation system protein [Pseudanabaena sp. SU_2_4]